MASPLSFLQQPLVEVRPTVCRPCSSQHLLAVVAMACQLPPSPTRLGRLKVETLAVLGGLSWGRREEESGKLFFPQNAIWTVGCVLPADVAPVREQMQTVSLPADSRAVWDLHIPPRRFWRNEDMFCTLSDRRLCSGLFPESSLIPQPGMLDFASAPSRSLAHPKPRVGGSLLSFANLLPRVPGMELGFAYLV